MTDSVKVVNFAAQKACRDGEGAFLDLMQWRVNRSGPVGMADDGYVLEYRNFDEGKNPFAWNIDRKIMTPLNMFDAAKVGVELLLAGGAEMLIHCGDVGGTAIVDLLAGDVPAYFVFGNTDWDRDELAAYARHVGVTCLGSVGQVQMGEGATAIVLHGDDLAAKRRALSQTGVAYVFAAGKSSSSMPSSFCASRSISIRLASGESPSTKNGFSTIFALTTGSPYPGIEPALARLAVLRQQLP